MKWTQGHWLRNKCSHGLRGILQSVKKYLVKTWESRTTIHGKMRTLITITTRLISTAHFFRHPRVALPKWMCVAGRIFLDKHFRVKRKYLLLFILNKKKQKFFCEKFIYKIIENLIFLLTTRRRDDDNLHNVLNPKFLTQKTANPK